MSTAQETAQPLPLREPSPEYTAASGLAETRLLPIPADLYARLQDYATATGNQLEQALVDILEKALRRVKRQTERERVLQALETTGLLLPPEPAPPRKFLSAQQRAALVRKFGIGRPLSEIIIEERANQW